MLAAAMEVGMTADASCGLSGLAAGGVVAVVTGRQAIEAAARRAAGKGEDGRVCEREEWTR